MDTTTIAQTIRQQAGTMTMMGLGARDLVALDATAERSGGLMFRVGPGGRTHWKMIVELTPMDTYTVHVVKLTGRMLDEKGRRTIDGVYADQLGRTLELQLHEAMWGSEAL